MVVVPVVGTIVVVGFAVRVCVCVVVWSCWWSLFFVGVGVRLRGDVVVVVVLALVLNVVVFCVGVGASVDAAIVVVIIAVFVVDGFAVLLLLCV